VVKNFFIFMLLIILQKDDLHVMAA